MKWSSFLVATAFVVAAVGSPVAALPTWAKRRPRQGRGKCTMILVGANATVDGYAYAMHTDDAGYGATDYRLVKVPAKTYNGTSEYPVYAYANGYPRVVTNDRGPAYTPKAGQTISTPVGYIPQKNMTTYAYFESDYGMQNEKQLSIAESTTSAKTAGWLKGSTPAPGVTGKCMFGIDALTRVALERCDSARCAVKLMGELAERYGFFSADSGDPNNPDFLDSGEALGLADKYGELWIFNVLTGINNEGAIWAAQRLDGDVVHVNANDLTIREIDLANTDRFYGTKNMVAIAEQQGWYDSIKDGKFDFWNAFAEHEALGGKRQYTWRRLWRVYSLVAPSQGFSADDTVFPVGVKPDKKLSLKDDIFPILRDAYEGTKYDLTQGIAAGPFNSPTRYDTDMISKYTDGSWERAISIFRGIFSFVAVVRPDMPDAIGGQFWYGWDQASGTVFHPLYVSATKMPKGYIEYGAQSKWEPESPWRWYNVINNWANLRYNKIIQDITAESRKWEDAGFAMAKETDRLALEAWGDGSTSAQRDKAIAIITDRTTAHADALNGAWKNFSGYLMAKWANGYNLTGEGATDWIEEGYPDWWLAITDYVAFPNTDKLSLPYKSEMICAHGGGGKKDSVTITLSFFALAMVMVAVVLSWLFVAYFVVNYMKRKEHAGKTSSMYTRRNPASSLEQGGSSRVNSSYSPLR